MNMEKTFLLKVFLGNNITPKGNTGRSLGGEVAVPALVDEEAEAPQKEGLASGWSHSCFQGRTGRAQCAMLARRPQSFLLPTFQQFPGSQGPGSPYAEALVEGLFLA